MNTESATDETPLEVVLHTCLGAVFVIALAVMVIWPQVQTLVV